ncbi:hypothetical protein AB4Z40_19720 [Bosea sp. 2YAB26]|uniref:hypothetical protein n=1 Tax=Bosea sp. 2YAB26 TaxID=3237478 RepID=UPI003F8DA355
MNFAKLRALVLAYGSRFRELAIAHEKSFRVLFGSAFMMALALPYLIMFHVESWGDTLQFSTFMGVSAGVGSHLADKVVS